MDIGERLVDELNCKDIFSFDIFGLNITIKESIVVMWIIMAVIMILSLLLTRNLKIEGKISKRQLFLEMCVEKWQTFSEQISAKARKIIFHGLCHSPF